MLRVSSRYMARSKTEGKAKKEKSGKPQRLVILDSHAILHRAYHALPDFSSAKGEPTGALYGLILMLLKIHESLKPDFIIATRDLPGKTIRHEEFDGYKAKRAEIDGELKEQLGRAPGIFDAFGIPVYSKAGYEADDMIGCIVHALKGKSDFETIIATGDMDTLQLVDGKRVKVFTLRKGLSDTVIYDEDAVKERYGFGPEYIVDYKALRGDPSDNIPGVRGIGEKTATELIKEFGTIEDLYKALAKGPKVLEERGVKTRTIELLLAQKAEAAFSKRLAQIHGDVDIEFSLPKRHWNMSDHAEGIAKMLEELEFRSLRERLSGVLNLPAHDTHTPQDVDATELEEARIALWLLRSDLSNPTFDDVLQFAHTDNFKTAREAVFKELRATGRLAGVFESIEKPLIPVIKRMNETGVLLDVGYLRALEREYASELSKIGMRIYKYVGHEFNINSPKQLGDVLYDELKIKPEKQKKTATGARTTREEELVKLSSQHPIIEDVLSYRELQKLLGTYIEKMPKLVGGDSRLHTQFLQAGSATGRMACQDPNLQNIPIKTETGRRIRKGFIAPRGFSIVAIDYSQIELRIAAGLSGDKKLVRVFQEGRDVHTEVAAEVFGVPHEHVDYEMRRRAKVINFGILYGMGVNALRANLGATVSRDEAAKFLDDYFKNFAGLARYIERTKADAAREGFTETLFGRRRYFPALKSPLPNLRAQAERMAVNAPIQGTQADIIKRAMVEADELLERKKWRDTARLLMQVHDELVYEIRSDVASEISEEIRALMENVVDPKLLSGVPIRAEISTGPDWGSVERVTGTQK